MVVRSELQQITCARAVWQWAQVSFSDKILEVGCGENAVWRDTDFNVVTMDLTRIPERSVTPDLIATGEYLPFKDKSFDIVCLGEVLEHVPNPPAILKEAVRVGRDKLIVTVPFEHAWPKALTPFQNPTHLRFYTPDSLRTELAGLALPHDIISMMFDSFVWLAAVVLLPRSAIVWGARW